MKKTQLLVLLRDIRSTIVSFISVVLFVALSVSIFLGFKWNGPALGTAADTYYDSHSYHDFSITFPYGLTEEDLEAVKSLDDISVAEGGYSSSCTTTLDNNQYLLGISSLTENVDCVTVKKGRLPEKENEIGIEELFAEKAGLKIGDKLTVQSDGENDYLNCSEFTVTAIVEIPSYCNPSSDYIRGMSTIGDGIIDYCGVVSESAFNKSAFDNCYSNIYIRCDCLTDYNSLDDEYENLSNEIKNKLSAVGEIQAKKRCSNVFSRYDNGIDTAEAQISEGQELIESAKLDVAYAKNRISESKTTLTDAEAEYADGLAQYNAGAAKLASAKPELESALVSAGFSKDIEDASNELNTAVPALKLINSALTLTVNDLNELKDKLDNAGTQSERDEILNDYSLLTVQLNLYIKLLDRYGISINIKFNPSEDIANSVDKIESVKKELDTDIDNLSKLSDAVDTYLENEKELISGKKELDAAAAEIASGKEELKKAEAALATGQTTLSEKENELSAGKAQLLQTMSKRDSLIEYSGWFISTRTDNAKSNSIVGNMNSDKRMCYSVASLFIFVGALICYSAIARLIRENQVMIGIQKALGFKKSEITKRYVLYSVFAVIIGIISGILLGYFVIERLINNAYYNFYVFPNISAFFNISDILIISAIEFVIVILAALIACRKLLARSAVSLIRGNDFSNVKNHAYEKTGFFKRSSLYTQTTVNNLANDKTRVIATLVGIVGCTALVVMAMTLLQTLGKTPVKHFSDVALYDQNVYCDNRVDNAMENVKKTLSDNNVSYLTAYQSILFIEDDEEVQHPATVVVPESKTDFTKFFNLTDESTGDALHLTGNGVIISYTYAKYFDTKVGDTIRLMTTDGKYYDVRVSGICQYYLSCYQIFMSRDYYKSIVSEPCDSNSALVNLDGTDSKELLSSLQKTDGFFSMNDDYANWVGIFNKMVSAINIAGYVALLLSFTMAMLVLLNLNVMFIGEKSRELIIMRVNGFGLSDTKKYIYRDNIILTILGIILGIALGIMLGLLVLVMMQLEGNHFYITPSLKACVIGIITSTLFAIITNLIALRKIGKLKLSDLSRV